MQRGCLEAFLQPFPSLPLSPSQQVGARHLGARIGSPLPTLPPPLRRCCAPPQVGAHHLDVRIDSVVAAMTNLFSAITGRMPRFRCGLLSGYRRGYRRAGAVQAR